MYAILLHGHQKLDRVARRHLTTLLGSDDHRFPNSKHILHFEGKRGPDAPRLKKRAGESPWHFIDPHREEDRELIGLIEQHYASLVSALREQHHSRAAFESAWLAHALVDGLTPAHHYPFGEAIEELRGEPHTTRKGLIGRAYVKGETPLQSVLRTFKLIGPHGVMTNHTTFEGGVYVILQPLKIKRGLPRDIDIKRFQELGIGEYFLQQAKEVAGFSFYARFLRRGWTPDLMRDVRLHLGPRLARLITLAWYGAYLDAQQPVPELKPKKGKKT